MFEKQAEAKTDFRTGNVPVDDAINNAKKWVSDLILTADNAFEEDEDIRDQFHLGGKIGRSVPKITGRMQALLATGEKYKDSLASWGFSEKDLKEGRDALNNLIEKDKEQELAVKVLPKTTQQLYILKAKAYLLLKRLARAARKVFRGDPATSDKFQLAILRRYGHKKGETVPATQTAPKS